ncbi:hypothetical protein Pint_36617 [Pistacia integerrima]|uniref:Uncharacterized protein n=1 Tax=Pistacia integerrima TaxID=434235 RepID=A0ACC0Y110_9ROSI|nr:hypothetical protein Pint_36617 [Pistacia integerrima]
MEEETQVSSEIPGIKSVEDVAVPVKVINGDMPEVGKEGKKEEEENTFDGEFIKVEKESLDVKDVSHVADTTSANDDKPSVVQRSSSGSSRELLEAQEKMKELELELERVAAALKHSESENTTLKDEVLLTKEKLEESGKERRGA